MSKRIFFLNYYIGYKVGDNKDYYDEQYIGKNL